MPSLNELLADTYTSHTVDLARFEAGEKRRVLAILKKLEQELARKTAAHDPTGVVRTAFQTQRLERLIQETRATIQSAYRDIRREIRADLRELGQVEHTFVTTSLNTAVGIDLVQPHFTTEQLRILADDILIQGAPTSEWWSRQTQVLQQRFLDQMRLGILQQEALGDLMRRVRGTRAGSFQDGIMRTSRRTAAMLVRSSVQTVANEVREATFQEHADLIKGKVWNATLDLRTTLICQVRDGKQYTLDNRPIGHRIPYGPGPGRIHMQCRSNATPITKSWAELSRNDALSVDGRRRSIREAFERKLREKGFSDAEIATTLTRSRASMDGQVPAELTFPQWLRKKDAASPGFGAQVLGPTRWGLWRSGKLSFTDLVDFDGMPLSIEQLRAKVGAA